MFPGEQILHTSRERVSQLTNTNDTAIKPPSNIEFNVNLSSAPGLEASRHPRWAIVILMRARALCEGHVVCKTSPVSAECANARVIY